MALFSKTVRAPLEYTKALWMRSWVFAVMLFLYIPLFILMAFSFNDSKRNVVWRGFTTKYYAVAWNNIELYDSMVNSLTIALIATVFSLILGALTAVMLWRFKFPFKGAVDGIISLPIIVPEICLGVAMLLFFSWIGWPSDLVWPFNMGAIIIAHITFCFPFVTMVVRSRLAVFNREQEEAAKDLGAGEWQTFRDILIPHIKPALIAGALLSFTLSLDDFVITFFTSTPGTDTFPVLVYSLVKRGVTPDINAASTILIILTVVLTAVALKFQDAQSIAESH
jgi:spermidine/putrescine transport system permease protein